MPEKTIKTWIVIPAYNEDQVIGQVIADTKKAGWSNIIVVDDGSTDQTAAEASSAGVITLSHRINRGKGAATKTGLEAAKMLNADIIITMDGDGQHNPTNLAQLIEPIVNGPYEVTLGTRSITKQQMPQHKVLSNQVANAVTWTMYGLWVKDSQSGLRAYSRQAADSINTSADHYNYESEVIREIRQHRLPYKEIPIDVRYTNYSMTKPTRQDMANGLKTLYKMIWSAISF